MNNTNEATRLVCLEAAQKLRTYAGIYTGDKQARRLVDELSNIADALATSAAPERSGKLADERAVTQLAGEVLGYAMFRDGMQTGVERSKAQAYSWVNAEAVPLYAALFREATATEADSSSAAPSDLTAAIVDLEPPVLTNEGRATNEEQFGYYHDGFREGFLTARCTAYYLARDAAPAPTGESLGAGADGLSYLVTGYGETDQPEIKIVATLDAAKDAVLAMMFDDGKANSEEDRENILGGIDDEDWPWEIKFEIGGIEVKKVFVHGSAAALATPRQTEDGGLSAAIKGEMPLVEPVFIGKALRAGREAYAVLDGGVGPRAAVHLVNIALQGWYHTKETAEIYANGYNAGVKHLRAAVLEVATLAPKDPAAQGGVPSWAACMAITDVPSVHEALDAFGNDMTGDNATCIVKAVLEAVAAPTGASK